MGEAFGTIIPFPQWRVRELYPHVGRIATEWGFMDFAVSGVTAILFSIPEAREEEVTSRAQQATTVHRTKHQWNRRASAVPG